jgi:hypothetical protein
MLQSGVTLRGCGWSEGIEESRNTLSKTAHREPLFDSPLAGSAESDPEVGVCSQSDHRTRNLIHVPVLNQ